MVLTSSVAHTLWGKSIARRVRVGVPVLLTVGWLRLELRRTLAAFAPHIGEAALGSIFTIEGHLQKDAFRG